MFFLVTKFSAKRHVFMSNTDAELLVSQTNSTTKPKDDNYTSLVAVALLMMMCKMTRIHRETDVKELLEKLKILKLENASLKPEIKVLKWQRGLADSCS